MNEGSGRHFFGLGPGWREREDEINEVAKRWECTLVNYSEPGRGKRHWLEGPNRGDPFDQAMATEVLRALREAGLWV